MTDFPPEYLPLIDRALEALRSGLHDERGRHYGRDVLMSPVQAATAIHMALTHRRGARSYSDRCGFGGKNLDLDMAIARAVEHDRAGVVAALERLVKAERERA